MTATFKHMDAQVQHMKIFCITKGLKPQDAMKREERPEIGEKNMKMWKGKQKYKKSGGLAREERG